MDRIERGGTDTSGSKIVVMYTLDRIVLCYSSLLRMFRKGGAIFLLSKKPPRCRQRGLKLVMKDLWLGVNISTGREAEPYVSFRSMG